MVCFVAKFFPDHRCQVGSLVCYGINWGAMSTPGDCPSVWNGSVLVIA